MEGIKLQPSTFRSTTTAMAIIAVISPVQGHSTSSSNTESIREEIRPFVRPVNSLHRSLIERTDGTIEFRENLWQPQIRDSDFATMTSSQEFPTYADNVRSILETSGWSASQLGDVIGVNRVTVQNWIAGKKLSSENLESIIQINDVISRAKNHAGKDSVERWLLTPSAGDGKNPKQLLSEGSYDVARTRAMVSPSKVRRIAGIQEQAKSSPWLNLLEGHSERE